MKENIGSPRRGRVKLPPIQRRTLENGLRVIVAEQHELPTVAVSLTVFSGSASNPLDRAGLAEVVSEMALLGTASRTEEQIAEEVDAMGASLVSQANWDSTGIASTALAADLGAILGLVAEAAIDPSFPEGEFELLKIRRLNELSTKLDNAAAVANDEYMARLFPDHPYGLPIDGTTASFAAMTRADLMAFHQASYRPGNAILIIVGDVDPPEVFDLTARSFERWERGAAKTNPAGSLPEVPAPRGIRIVLVDKPDLTQSQLRMGHLGVSRDTPDWFPLMLANYVLGGGGFSSRLMERIRVQRGYTYGLNTSFAARLSRGPFTLSTFTPHATLPDVITESLEVVNEFLSKGPGAQELEDARNFFVSGYPRNFETPGGIASALIEVELYGLGEDYIERYQDRTAAVTAEDVQRVARKYVDPENLIIVSVTNAADVHDRLAALGSVEVVAPRQP